MGGSCVSAVAPSTIQYVASELASDCTGWVSLLLLATCLIRQVPAERDGTDVILQHSKQFKVLSVSDILKKEHFCSRINLESFAAFVHVLSVCRNSFSSLFIRGKQHP